MQFSEKRVFEESRYRNQSQNKKINIISAINGVH